MPIPVASHSKACVCDRPFSGIASSNPAEGMDVCLLTSVVCCQIELSVSVSSLVQRSPKCFVCVCVCHCVQSHETLTLYAYNE